MQLTCIHVNTVYILHVCSGCISLLFVHKGIQSTHSKTVMPCANVYMHVAIHYTFTRSHNGQTCTTPYLKRLSSEEAVTSAIQNMSRTTIRIQDNEYS